MFQEARLLPKTINHNPQIDAKNWKPKKPSLLDPNIKLPSTGGPCSNTTTILILMQSVVVLFESNFFLNILSFRLLFVVLFESKNKFEHTELPSTDGPCSNAVYSTSILTRCTETKLQTASWILKHMFGSVKDYQDTYLWKGRSWLRRIQSKCKWLMGCSGGKDRVKVRHVDKCYHFWKSQLQLKNAFLWSTKAAMFPTCSSTPPAKLLKSNI